MSNTELLYGGAIRGAKSYWGLMELITLCWTYPKSRWLAMRATHGNLDNLINTFDTWFLQAGCERYVKKYDKSKNKKQVRWHNDSVLIFMAESFDTNKDLNHLRGLEINGGFIDELNEIQEITYDKLLERLGTNFASPGCPAKLFSSCNPASNWVKTRFYDRWKNGTLPKGIAYLQAKATDNPYIDKEFFEQKRASMSKFNYETFVEGNWDLQMKTGGEFYKCFELEKHIGDKEYDPELSLHISFDDNVNPYLPVGIFQVDGDRVWMIDEIAAKTPNNTVEKVCAEICRKYKGHANKLFVYGDATAKKEDTKMEKGHNFYTLVEKYLAPLRPSMRVTSSNPNVRGRGEWINTLLEKDNIMVRIDSKCKNAISDFVLVKEKEDGTKVKAMEYDPVTKKKYQAVGHFSDLFDYFMYGCFHSNYHKYHSSSKGFGIVLGERRQSKHSY